MTLAEEFEAAAKEAHSFPSLVQGDTLMVLMSDFHRLKYASLLDRAAELARDQERVVQSIVKREVT